MKKYFIIMLMLIISSFVLVDNAFAADPISKVCVANASGSASTDIDCSDADNLAEKIEGVVKTMTGLVGAFAVGMIVYGGFKYITSQGDPKAAESAKNIIWYAGVGLFIVLLAFMIFDLVKNALAM